MREEDREREHSGIYHQPEDLSQLEIITIIITQITRDGSTCNQLVSSYLGYQD